MIDWLKRCKCFKTQVADCRKWTSRCGYYKVEESDIRYGRVKDTGLPIIYRAMAHKEYGWCILSRHRKRSAAVKALEFFAANGYVKPKKQRKRVKRQGKT